MFFKKIKNKNNGSMMIEIILAVSIITVSVLAALNVAQKSIVISRQAIHSAQAAFLLEGGAESVKIFRDSNSWANFTNLFNPSLTYCMPNTISSWTTALSTASPCTPIGIFTRVVNVSDVNRDATSGDIVSSGGSPDSGTKLFTISVSWRDGGRAVVKTLKFYTSNIFP